MQDFCKETSQAHSILFKVKIICHWPQKRLYATLTKQQLRFLRNRRANISQICRLCPVIPLAIIGSQLHASVWVGRNNFSKILRGRFSTWNQPGYASLQNIKRLAHTMCRETYVTFFYTRQTQASARAHIISYVLCSHQIAGVVWCICRMCAL